MATPLSRRTFLRGAGAALALPWLEAMGPTFAVDATGERPAACRFVGLYVPLGVCNEQWYPTKTGPGLELSPTLQPLESVRGQLTVVSGLRHPHGVTHHACSPSFLNGRNYQRDPGITLDQVVVRAYGRATRFPSLHWTRDGGAEVLSFTTEGIGIPAVFRPDAIFQRLFVPDSQESREAARRTIANNRSMLDALRDDARRLSGRLGARDRHKLDEYLYSVRDVEQMVRQAERFLDTPKPEVSRDVLQSEWNGAAADVRVKFELLFLALQTDSTRVVSWLIDSEGGSPTFPHAGLTVGRHDFSHHGGDARKLEQLAASDRFYISELARFLEKLQNERVGSANLLDTTLVLYGSGLNNGSGFRNGTGSHVNDKMPLLLAGGRGLGIAGDRHIKIDDGSVPATNLHLSILHAMGIRDNSFSDSLGVLRGLTA